MATERVSKQMQAKVAKTFRFEASHSLPNHDGKCRNLHGHSYKLVVECEGPINREKGHAKEGMVIDFSDVKAVFNKLKPYVDHVDLNASLGFITTAENISWWFLEQFRFAGVPVTSVTVYETETSSATVKFSEVWSNGESPIGANASRTEVPSS